MYGQPSPYRQQPGVYGQPPPYGQRQMQSGMYAQQMVMMPQQQVNNWPGQMQQQQNNWPGQMQQQGNNLTSQTQQQREQESQQEKINLTPIQKT